jgi:phage-related protein
MGEAFTALNGVGNETERDAIAMQLFGKSAMELNPLIKAGGDELNRLAKEARDSGAVMSNEAIAGLDTFGDAMDHLKTSLVGKFGEAFAELAPTLTEFTEKVKAIDLTPLVDGFKWLLENATLIAGGAIAIGTGMAMWNVVSTIQAVVSAIKTWQIATKGMTAAQLIFNLVMMANPIGIIITAVAALTAGIIFLWNTNEGFRTAILETWKNIKDGVAGAIKAVTDTIASWKKVGEDIINGMIEGIKSGVAGLVNAIKNAVQSAITKAKSVLGIRSPSSVFRDQVGLMIGEGMAQGINNSTGSVNNAMNNLNRQLTTDANFKLNTTASQGKPQSAVRTGAIMNVVINVKSAAEATRELGILSKQLAGQF